MIRIAACLAVVLFALLPTTSARADTGPCTVIRSLPAVITSQGTYCLEHDLSTAISRGEAISIQANNVTIDCRHRKIGGLASGTGSHASGIFAMDRKNITIRNCAIRGFASGIFLFGSGGAYHLVEDNRIDLALEDGILAMGDGTMVRGNRIYDIGSTRYSARGITTFGAASVVDNTIQGARTTGSRATGIAADTTTGPAFISGNRISGLSAQDYVTGIDLWGEGIVTGNSLIRHGPAAGKGTYGIACHGGTHVVQGNTAIGFGSGAALANGCTLVTGNFTP